MTAAVVQAAVAAPSAARLAADVRHGRAGPAELVEAALDRLAAVDGEVRAFVAVDEAGAREQARSAPDGPLRGVPVAVKDLFDVRGQVTSAGSAVPPGPAARDDADAVARLRAAGAVVLGRTRTHEFAWGLTTQHEELGGTGNPWDLARVPGGSSGGSAAAVAAGVVPLALGTDTGCSIRLPAAWCGLVGHKPTWGAVSLRGCVPLAPTLDTGGALVRTVEDVRLWMLVLAGLSLPAGRPGGRVGVVATDGLDPDVGRLFDDACTRAGALGLRRQEVTLPGGLREAYAGVQAGEALAWHAGTGRWPAHAAAYGSDVRGHLERAAALTPDRAAEAERLRAAARRAAAVVFEQVDLLLLPVASHGPPPAADPDVGGPVRDGVLPWTLLANLCGLPACSVPAGLDDDGLPVGVQVVGPAGRDARVLDLAEHLQVPLPWPAA